MAPFWPGPTSIILSHSHAQVRCCPWVLVLSWVQTCSWEIDSQGAVIRWQVTVLKDCYCSNRAFNSDKESWESFLACAMQSAHLMVFFGLSWQKKPHDWGLSPGSLMSPNSSQLSCFPTCCTVHPLTTEIRYPISSGNQRETKGRIKTFCWEFNCSLETPLATSGA